jgi:hypothetical protein
MRGELRQTQLPQHLSQLGFDRRPHAATSDHMQARESFERADLVFTQLDEK